MGAFLIRGWNLTSPSAAGSTNPIQSAISQRGWCFYTVQGDIDPGDLRFRLLYVGVVNIWSDL